MVDGVDHYLSDACVMAGLIYGTKSSTGARQVAAEKAAAGS